VFRINTITVYQCPQAMIQYITSLISKHMESSHAGGLTRTTHPLICYANASLNDILTPSRVQLHRIHVPYRRTYSIPVVKRSDGYLMPLKLPPAQLRARVTKNNIDTVKILSESLAPSRFMDKTAESLEDGSYCTDNTVIGLLSHLGSLVVCDDRESLQYCTVKRAA